MPKVEDALLYAQEGMFIFPVHSCIHIPGGHIEGWGDTKPLTTCDCGDPDCLDIGKHPVVSHKLATCEYEQIHLWWGGRARYNIGVKSRKSYLVVLDVDPRSGGWESLARLQKDLGINFLGHRMYETGGGGVHIQFSAFTISIGVATIPGYPGLDVKGNVSDNYVILPPSNHKSGGKYKWINRVPPQDIPDALLDLISKKGVTPFGERTEVSQSKLKVPIMKLEGMEGMKDFGSYLKGKHPVHGATGGGNLIVYKADNFWICKRCGSKGRLLEMAAILAGLCECSDFVPGKQNPLKGQMFTKAIAACIILGVTKDEMVAYLGKEAPND